MESVFFSIRRINTIVEKIVKTGKLVVSFGKVVFQKKFNNFWITCDYIIYLKYWIIITSLQLQIIFKKTYILPICLTKI